MLIDLAAARSLLDFGKRIGGGARADAQLAGAVAIHNILQQHRVAYLADEVGMGKTYVALGALALFRHFQPDFRVLVIAPRENIQLKWQKEMARFIQHNVKFDDLRVRGIGGLPARALVSCGSLLELLEEVSVDRERDFFVRMSSFSVTLSERPDDWKLRDELRRQLPWLPVRALAQRDPQAFKEQLGRVLACALPEFDLVIVDEAHNLKHGYSPQGSARNQVLGVALGGRAAPSARDVEYLRQYGRRASRVLFLSATPLEETYHHLWNQLDLFGLSTGFEELRDPGVSPERKKELAARFLVRRVTSLQIAGKGHTKNMYRREWRAGGVVRHDEPITVTDPRQRLVIALVQKKVSELLNGKKFNRSFQIGMLASFESFLETSKLKREEDSNLAVFDDASQAVDAREREGLDVHDVNRLALSYREEFGREMPHPKMDAVVEGLSSAWHTGKKALIFVRRVASVKELKRKLDERYDEWLIPYLRSQLTPALGSSFDEAAERYRREKAAARRASLPAPVDADREEELGDDGGKDTFFAWFFRGQGPSGLVSGADIQGRFIKGSGVYSTSFEQNHVAALLESEPGRVIATLAVALGCSPEEASERVRRGAVKYLSAHTKIVTRASRMEAAQAAALELLHVGGGRHALRAGILWQEVYQSAHSPDPVREAPPEIAQALERRTFFTELCRPEHKALRALIWPDPVPATYSAEAIRAAVVEQELRAELLSTAARLGHAAIDLYVVAVAGRSTLNVGPSAAAHRDEDEEDGSDARGKDEPLLRDFLAVLESQRAQQGARPWGALDELSEIAGNFDLVVDLNLRSDAARSLGERRRHVAGLLRRQQPTAGMAGRVNQTVVRQFRMPGYPFVLITTDVLQEGEDLHTFCSAVHHYGISWTPSSMEQRIGRIDRVRSQTERRLAALAGEPQGDDWLQVYFPHLQDSVEVLQVEKVLHRMNEFLQLMHEGVTVDMGDQSRVDLARDLLAPRRRIAAIRDPLRSSFPVQEEMLRGPRASLAVNEGLAGALLQRLEQLSRANLSLGVSWQPNPPFGSLLGTARLPSGRVQPFTLLLRSEQGNAVVRCISPIGRTLPDEDPQPIVRRAAHGPCRIGAILTRREKLYDLTVEDDVLLAAPEHDAARVGLLLQRVTEQADHMEQAYFADGRDAPLDAFESDLRQEVGHVD